MMTFDPHPWRVCRSRIARPISQYSSIIWVLTVRWAVDRAAATRVFRSAKSCA
jgi:hypothetical protein